MLAYSNYYNPAGYLPYNLKNPALNYQYPYLMNPMSPYRNINPLYLFNNLNLRQQNFNQTIGYNNNLINNLRLVPLYQFYNQNNYIHQPTPIMPNNFANTNLNNITNPALRQTFFQSGLTSTPNIPPMNINKNTQTFTNLNYFPQNNINLNNQIINNNLIQNQITAFDNSTQNQVTSLNNSLQPSLQINNNNMLLPQITSMNNNIGLNLLNSPLNDPLRLSLKNKNTNDLEINQLFPLDNNNNSNNLRLSYATPMNNTIALNQLYQPDNNNNIETTNLINGNNIELNQLLQSDNNNNNIGLTNQINGNNIGLTQLLQSENNNTEITNQINNNNLGLNQLFQLDNNNNIEATNLINNNNNILLNQIQNINDISPQPQMFNIENNNNIINTNDLNNLLDINNIQRKTPIKIPHNNSPPKMNINNQFINTNNNPFILDEQNEQQNNNIITNIEQNNLINNQNLQTNFTIENSPQQNNFYRSHYEVSHGGRNILDDSKLNQDSYIVSTKIADIPGFNLFGVLDGHGNDGHFASNFAKDYILQEIAKFAQKMKIKGIETAEGIFQILKNENFNTITQIYKNTDQEMMKQPWDYQQSGTTCNIVFQFSQYLLCANVGDSRSILIYDNNPNLVTSEIVNLSYDHKPDIPEELQRIQVNGGCLRRVQDADGKELEGPLRVYKGDEDYPGLAMSRSLGDILGKKCGVIPNPEFVEYILNDTSKYMVICTDGVSEFINDEQIKNIGNPFYLKNNIVGHCESLINNSVKMWEQNDLNRDDITVVIVYF